MANDLTGNPLRVDTAATAISADADGVLVQAIEWIDDDAAAGGAMTANDNLIMHIDGVLVQMNCVIALSQTWVQNFAQPLRVRNLVVDTIDGGTLLIWKA